VQQQARRRGRGRDERVLRPLARAAGAQQRRELRAQRQREIGAQRRARRRMRANPGRRRRLRARETRIDARRSLLAASCCLDRAYGLPPEKF
jgi:hypothetical protein